jgi:glycosyltransferase involved in cell wall biosynthesis
MAGHDWGHSGVTKAVNELADYLGVKVSIKGAGNVWRLEKKIIPVIVLFKNNEELIAPFFHFLRLSVGPTDLPIRVYAVDNASSDHTAELLKERLLEHDVLLSSCDCGIATLRNIALAAIRKDFNETPNFLILDSDSFVMRRHSIQSMHRQMDDDTVGIIQGMAYRFAPMKPFDTAFWNIPGICAAMIRGSCVDQLAMFDEGFGFYYDDSLMWNIFHYAGFSVRDDISAVFIHQQGATLGGALTAASFEVNKARQLSSDTARYNAIIQRLKSDHAAIGSEAPLQWMSRWLRERVSNNRIELP